MTRLGGGVEMETRLARYAMLWGNMTAANRHYFNALSLAKAGAAPSRETIAWCQWQLGETAFAVGDCVAAEQNYRAAPGNLPGLLSRALPRWAAFGRRAEICRTPFAVMRRATNIIPDPAFVAALGDLYHLAGRQREADAQYTLVEHIAHLSKFNGALYNRQAALFYADHDRKPMEAYLSAVREYRVRQDIYGADAVAWTALKAGKLDRAQQAMKTALRLGTQEARLFYHAGMIARAAEDVAAAETYLKRALALNPCFDPLQAPIAAHSLTALAANRENL